MQPDAVNLWTQVFSAIAGVAGVVLFILRFVDKRTARRREATVQAAADEAATQATNAATHSRESTASVNETTQALLFMAETLGRTQAARDREAKQNDEVMGAFLRQSVLLDQQQLPQRLRRMEEHFAAEEIRRRHQQGALDEQPDPADL